MNVLGIETSGQIGSVAAWCDGIVVYEETLAQGMEHGRMLVPLIDRVVHGAQWDRRRDIDLIAVSQGPGSFTGLRVGMACAKSMATMLGRPIKGVCSFDAMAENAPPEWKSILCVLDAKRDEVYAAGYERRGDAIHRVTDPAVMSPAATRNLLAWSVYVMGDGLRRHAPAYQPPGFYAAPEDHWRIRASVVARLGLRAYLAEGPDDAERLEPIYIRLAEAEERRLAKERQQQ